jgi:hypothetical protein
MKKTVAEEPENLNVDKANKERGWRERQVTVAQKSSRKPERRNLKISNVLNKLKSIRKEA